MHTTARRRWTQNVAVAAVLTVLSALLILSVVPPGPDFLDMPRPVFDLIAEVLPDVFPGKSSDTAGDAPALAPPLPAAPVRQGQDVPGPALVAFVPVAISPPPASPTTLPAGAPLVPAPPSMGAEEPEAPTGTRTVTSVPPPSPAEERALAKAERAAAKAEKAAARAEEKADKTAEKPAHKVTPVASAESAKPSSAAAAPSSGAAPAVKQAASKKDHAVKKDHAAKKASGKPAPAVKKPGRSKVVAHKEYRPPAKGKAAGEVRQAKQDNAPPAKKSVGTPSKK